ncbi:MAG: hypothetical protein U1F19_01690 [Lysobacterales bacterium]
MIDFNALAQAGIRSLRAYDPGHDLGGTAPASRAALAEIGFQ